MRPMCGRRTRDRTHVCGDRAPMRLVFTAQPQSHGKMGKPCPEPANRRVGVNVEDEARCHRTRLPAALLPMIRCQTRAGPAAEAQPRRRTEVKFNPIMARSHHEARLTL